MGGGRVQDYSVLGAFWQTSFVKINYGRAGSEEGGGNENIQIVYIHNNNSTLKEGIVKKEKKQKPKGAQHSSVRQGQTHKVGKSHFQNNFCPKR